MRGSADAMVETLVQTTNPIAGRTSPGDILQGYPSALGRALEKASYGALLPAARDQDPEEAEREQQGTIVVLARVAAAVATGRPAHTTGPGIEAGEPAWACIQRHIACFDTISVAAGVHSALARRAILVPRARR